MATRARDKRTQHRRHARTRRPPTSALAGTLAALAALAPALAAAQSEQHAARPASSAPSSSALVDYVVQPGDTCPVVAQRLYGSSRRVDLLHRNNPQLGPVPHHLQPGQVLHVPRRADAAPANAGPDARLTFVRHNVETFTPEQHPGRPNDPLSRGDRVNTEAESSAEVTFLDETQLQLAERTLIVILGDTRAQSARQSTAADTTLVNGSLRLHLAALAGRPATVPIRTEAARVVVEPGEAQLAVDPARTTRVAVYAGRSRVSAQRRTVAVPQGFGSRTDRGRAPRPPQRLPDAPAWVHAPARVVFTPRGDATVEGEYGPGVGTGPRPAQWHVQVARDVRFNDLVVDVRVPLAVTRLSARNLTPAAYYTRVSAIDADQFEGAFNAPSDVAVVSATPRPVPAGRHRASVALPTGLFCGLDGAALTPVTGPLEFDTRRAHRLRCAGTSNGEGGAEVELPAEPIGPVSAQADLAQSSPGALDGVVTLRLVMADGEGYWGALAPAIQSTAGVTAGTPEPVEGQAGVYRVPVRWRAGTTGFALQVRVGDDQLVTTAPIAVRAPPAPVPAPAPAPAPPANARPWAFELALLGGIDAPSNGLDVGPHLGGELGVRYSLGTTAVGLALRAAYERYEAGAVPARLCTNPPPTGTCGTEIGRPATAALVEEVVSLALPLTFRLTPPDARVIPYIALAPQLLFERSSTTESAGTTLTNATWFGFSGHVGAQARVGPGGVFLELGGRVGAAPRRVLGETTTGTFELLGGYRFVF